MRKVSKKWGINIVLVLCVAVAIFAGWKLWSYLRLYKAGEEEYENLREYVHERDDSEKKSSEKKDRCPITVDFEQLQQINPETVGWIYIEGSGINYPVVQSSEGEEQYYLNHTFEGEENFSGAIFMDPLCQPGFTSDNSIIYGHNLKSGEMFGYLKTMYDTDYNPDAEYDKYPVIWILTPYSVLEYKVFAGREISAAKDKKVYTVEFGSSEEQEAYLKEMKQKSLFRTEVDVSEPEAVITLSTCTSDTEDGRFVVQGILVQETDQEE